MSSIFISPSPTLDNHPSVEVFHDIFENRVHVVLPARIADEFALNMSTLDGEPILESTLCGKQQKHALPSFESTPKGYYWLHVSADATSTTYLLHLR